MSPTLLVIKSIAPSDRLRTRQPGSSQVVVPADLASLGLNSHRPEVQAVIRDAIRRGEVRAVPTPGWPDCVTLVPGETRGER
jgi:hypothetical protein